MQPGDVAKQLHEQLRDAWEESEITLAQLRALLLRDRAHLDINITSLSRKLSGNQVMSTEEAEALARVLKRRITSGRGREARAS